MQNKPLTISSNNVTHILLLFIVLLTIGVGLYGYNSPHAWLAEKKYALNTVANALQKRIGNYRYVTYQLYDKFGHAPLQNAAPSLQAPRLHTDVYYVGKPHKNNRCDDLHRPQHPYADDGRQYF